MLRVAIGSDADASVGANDAHRRRRIGDAHLDLIEAPGDEAGEGAAKRHVAGKRETGGGAALPIWIDFMRAALAGRPNRDFAVPEGIVFARVERDTGKPAGLASGDTYFQAFATGTEPGEDDVDGPVTAQESDRLLRRDAF